MKEKSEHWVGEPKFDLHGNYIYAFGTSSWDMPDGGRLRREMSRNTKFTSLKAMERWAKKYGVDVALQVAAWNKLAAQHGISTAEYSRVQVTKIIRHTHLGSLNWDEVHGTIDTIPFVAHENGGLGRVRYTLQGDNWTTTQRAMVSKYIFANWDKPEYRKLITETIKTN